MQLQDIHLKNGSYAYDYGVQVKFDWRADTSEPLQYTTVNTAGSWTGTFGGHSSGFYWYDESKDDFIISVKGDELPTITNTFYDYSLSNITTISEEDNPKAVSMLFGTSNSKSKYWLASRFQYFDSKGKTINYGIHRILYSSDNKLQMNFKVLYYSSNWYTEAFTYGVRAVVTLDSRITVAGSSSAGWSYKVS